MSTEEIIMIEAKHLQQEMHKHIEWMMNKNKDLTYEDCKTLFFIIRIAELKINIKNKIKE